jgi:hypothetical protein
LSVVKLRIEIERALRDFTAAHGIASEGPMSISKVLNDLKQRSVAPPSTEQFLEALHIMNGAAHGLDVDSTAVEQAIIIGTVFLAELSASSS